MASEDGRAASDEEAVPEQQVTLNEQMMYHVLWQNDLLLDLPQDVLRSVLPRVRGDKAKDAMLYSIKLYDGYYDHDDSAPHRSRYHTPYLRDYAHFQIFHSDVILLADFDGGFQDAVDYTFEVHSEWVDAHTYQNTGFLRYLSDWCEETDWLLWDLLDRRARNLRAQEWQPSKIMRVIVSARKTVDAVWYGLDAPDTVARPSAFGESYRSMLGFFERHARRTARLLAYAVAGSRLPLEMVELVEGEYVRLRVEDYKEDVEKP